MSEGEARHVVPQDPISSDAELVNESVDQMPVGEDDREGLCEVEGEEEEFVPERAPVDIDVRARTIAVEMASLSRLDVFGETERMQAAEQGSVHASRRRRRQRGDDVNRRAARALRLVQLGEASSARQALEGAEVALGTLDTLNQLRDENRRPPVPRSPVPEDIVNARPEHPFSLDCEQFLLNLRSKRGVQRAHLA